MQTLRRWLAGGGPALGAGGLALILYSYTLAPGLSWAHHGADGGDLLAAALTAGVPHPTGYPTYQLLLRCAIALHPADPARAGNWLSAFCAAAAVAGLADLTRRMLPASRWRGPLAISAALVWAASPALWSQAIITEVYATHALAAVLLLWLLWLWRAAITNGRRAWPWLTLVGLLAGLGLGNHLTLALMLPGIMVWVCAGLRIRRDNGETPSPRGGRGAELLCAFLGLMLGLSVYIYLPWAASGDPPVNWGNPRTCEDFWWLVSGEAYRGLVFGLPWAELPGRLAAGAGELGRQLGGGPWGALIALIGLWQLEGLDRPWWRVTLLVAFAYSAYAIGYNTADSYVYLIPVWAIGALWLAAGLGQLVVRRPADADRAGVAPRITQHAFEVGVACLLIALPALSMIRYWPDMDLRGDRGATEFVESALTMAVPGAIILVQGDAPTFALWYARYGLGRRPDVTPVNVSLFDYPWYRATLLRRHPALAELAVDGDLPPLAQFMAGVSARWPMYRAGPVIGTAGEFTEQPEGVLTRLTR